MIEDPDPTRSLPRVYVRLEDIGEERELSRTGAVMLLRQEHGLQPGTDLSRLLAVGARRTLSTSATARIDITVSADRRTLRYCATGEDGQVVEAGTQQVTV